MFMKMQKQEGFTLIELLIVIVILGILGAVAIPRFSVSRDEARINACKTNQSILDTAIQLHDFEKAAAFGDAGDLNDLVPDYIKKVPVCPEGGTYSYTIANGVVCSLEKHMADPEVAEAEEDAAE